MYIATSWHRITFGDDLNQPVLCQDSYCSFIPILGLCLSSAIFQIGRTVWKQEGRVGPIYRLADIFDRYRYRYIGIGNLDIVIGHIGIGIGIG